MKTVYKIAFLMALVSLLVSIVSGITLITSLERSAIVFLGTLIIILVSMVALKWGIQLTKPPKEEPLPEVTNQEIENA